jgi:hypothetical protein
MRVVHTAEGSANIVQRGSDQTRKRDNDWCLTRADDFVVNEKTERRILEHGGNVTGDANGSQAGVSFEPPTSWIPTTKSKNPSASSGVD